jgi:hypothetical protein
VGQQDRRTGGPDVTHEQTALGRCQAGQVEPFGPGTGAADQSEGIHREMSRQPPELYGRTLQEAR